ncbi:Uroporphyrinogen decarboxylase [Neomoorella glycerini]|uniref:Uroporphyrinogen decarboxylase n=1 Tax=Neomoorella glycerini TaxID=55779 RepID=A0A6I5ZS20_9FIRM|nr:uroporphyrinogen decarboxylase family protein [Moorella glycerini]QGP92536.1 Uroporphyrinogen decarboxylase [Moorella glycerini]
MTHKERVIRTIKRESIDFLPSQIDFTPSDVKRICTYLGISESEDALHKYADNHLIYAYSLSSAEEYMHNQRVLDYALKHNLARVDDEHHVIFDQWGVGWDTESEGVWVAVHPLADIAAYKDYQFPDPQVPHLMDEVERVVHEYGQEYFILGFQHISLFERAWALRGYENFMMDIYVNPDFVQELLDRITDYQVACAKRFVAAGVDGVRIGDDYGLQKGLMMKPETWRKLFKPRLAKIYAVYQEAGLPVFQHSCGDISSILPDLIEIGLSVIHPVQPLAMSIEELAEKYADRLIFFGGIDTQQVLPYGSPEKVRDATRRCVQILGSKKGYIVAPSQEVMTDVPLENVAALISAVKEFRLQIG